MTAGEPTVVGNGVPGSGSDVAHFFPTQKRTEGPRLTPEALAVGELVADDGGCLRFGSGPYAGSLPIWPPGYALRAEGGDVRVVDGRGQVVARVGDEVRAGRGEDPGSSLEGVGYLDERSQRELPRRCPGPYFLVGQVLSSRP